MNLKKFIEKKNSETFNFHCHQHLVDQVENTGSLGVNNCFPFEGWFFNTKCIPAGTRNHFGQVVAKVNFKVKLHFQTDDISIKDNLRNVLNKNLILALLNSNIINWRFKITSSNNNKIYRYFHYI